MTVTWKILYPREAKFDFEYYTKKHMPLAESLFGPVLVDWEVVKLGCGQASPFHALTTLVFTGMGEHQAVMNSAAGAQLLGDIENYSDKAPIMMQQTEAIRRHDS